MKKNNKLSRPKTTIDINLISLAYNNRLSKSQKLIFDKWINEDFRRRLYFEKAKRFQEGKGFEKEIVDIETDWIKLEKRLNEQNYQKKSSS